MHISIRYNWVFYICLSYLSVHTKFLITLNRVVIFIWPKFYNNYMNTKNSIFSIFIFDISIYSLTWIFLSSNSLYIFCYFLLTISSTSSLAFSIGLSIKIHVSSKNLNQTTNRDFKRAIIYCIIQSTADMTCIGIILFQLVAIRILLESLNPPDFLSNMFILSIIVGDLCIVFFIIVESLSMIFVLKLYRNAIVEVSKKIRNVFKKSNVYPIYIHSK
jgi:hypothetical protein